MIGMNNPLPMNSNGGGTVIVGDVTLVQNHNFGMGNPQMQMMQMQQQMALQQQQNNMMLLGMANVIAKQNQKLKMIGGYDEPIQTLENKSERVLIEESNIPEHQPKSFSVDDNVQTVEFTVRDADHDDNNDYIAESKEHEKPATVARHMCKFFTSNEELKDDIQFNRFYKVEEDTRTFVIFIKKNSHNPAAWRKIFRDAYRSHQSKVIKGPLDDAIVKQDAIYIAILFSTQGGKPDIIFIDKKMNGRDYQLSNEMMEDYVYGIDMKFGNMYRLCEPYIPETESHEISNYHDIQHPCCHVRDTLFSNALYITSDM